MAETYTLTFGKEEMRWLWAALDFTRNDIRNRLQDSRSEAEVGPEYREALQHYTAMMDRIKALAGQ